MILSSSRSAQGAHDAVLRFFVKVGVHGQAEHALVAEMNPYALMAVFLAGFIVEARRVLPMM